MSPKVKHFFEILGRLFKAKERDVPENEDDLGAYPLRMQISAIPERRYLRTARLFAVFTFINLAVLIAIAGVFVYRAARIDVQVANSRVVNMYAMDPERKVIQASEYERRFVSAMSLVEEQIVRDFIKARSSYFIDPIEQKRNWGSGSKLEMLLIPDDYKKFIQETSYAIVNEAKNKKVNKEPFIYTLTRTPGGLWEALVDVFDMPPYDPFDPVCACQEVSKECIACKEEHNKGRHRFKIYVRLGRMLPPTLANPFGYNVMGYFAMPVIIHPEEKFWGIPSILKPDL